MSFYLGINCGGGALSPLIADNYYSGSSATGTRASCDTSTATNPLPNSAYLTIRNNTTAGGGFPYTLPVTASTTYTVRVHFNSGPDNNASVNLSINGASVMSAFAPNSSAGGNLRAIIQTFTVVQGASTSMVFDFSAANSGYFDVTAIEVYEPDSTPPVITGFQAVSTGTTEILLGYSAADNVGIAGYDLEFSATGANLQAASGASGWTNLLSNANQNLYIHTGRAFGVQWFYRVRAKDTFSNVSAWSATSGAAAGIGLYSVFEREIPATGTYSIPQDDLPIVVTLTSPTSVTKVIDAFYYSENVWRFRFAANEIGNWSWSAAIPSQTTQTGSFTVVASTNKGFITRHSTDVYSLVTSTNEPFYPLGIGDVVNPNGLAGGVVGGAANPGTFCWAFNGDTRPPSPTDGDYTDIDTYFNAYGNGRFNTYRLSLGNVMFNVASISSSGNTYFDEFSRQVDLLVSKIRGSNMRTILVFMNAVNADESTNGRLAYKKYFKYCIARWGASVDFYEVSNESAVSVSFLNDVAAYVKTKDIYGHLISSSPVYGANEALDFTEATYITPHYYYTESSEFAADTETAAAPATAKTYNKPIIYGEIGFTGYNYFSTSQLRLRIRFWTAFFNKFSLVPWDGSFAKDSGEGGGGAATAYIGTIVLGYLEKLSTFIAGFALSGATTGAAAVSNSSAVRGYTLSGASGYAAYLHAYTNHTTATSGGTITVNPQAAGTAAWYNPSTGATVGTPAQVSAGSQTLSVPSFTTDIALKIAVPSSTDTIAPTVPTNLAASVISSSQINYSWSASTDAVGVTGYDLQFATDSGFTANLVTVNLGNVTAYNRTGLAASTLYYARVRAHDAAPNNSAYSSSVNAATQAGGGGGGGSNFVLTAADLQENTHDEDKTDYFYQNPLARAVFDTSATQATVKFWCNEFTVASGAISKIDVLVDIGSGYGSQELLAATADGLNTLTVNFAAGAKRIAFVNSPQLILSSGIVEGTFFKEISFNQTATKVLTALPNRVMIIGDSIPNGFFFGDSVRDGWAAKLRILRPVQSFMVEGVGSLTLREYAGTAGKRAAAVTEIGQASPKYIWLQLMTNDYGQSGSSGALAGQSAANFQTQYAALLDAVNAALPSVHIFCQTAIVRADETANSFGNTLSQYRAAAETVVSTRTSFATLVDGTQILASTDLADGLHPSPAGHLKYALWVNAYLTAYENPPQPIVSNWSQTNLVPTAALEAWNSLDAAASGGSVADFSGNNRILTAAAAPVLQSNVLNGYPGIYFNGSSGDPLKYTGNLTARHIFILASYSDALFGSNSGLLTDSTNAILIGANGANKFYNAGFSAGGDYKYRKSDIIYDESNQVAPMSGAFALIEVALPYDIAMNSIQIGQDRTYTTQRWRGFYLESLIYSQIKNDCERADIYQYFAIKYHLWRQTAAALDIFPFYGSRRDEASASKIVLSDGQNSPITRIKRGARTAFSLNCDFRLGLETLAARDFWDTHYPGENFVYEDTQFLPPVQKTCRFPVPSEFKRTGAGRVNRFDYSVEIIES